MGFLEISAALVLLLLSFMANRVDIGEAFGKAEKVARRASHQVREVRFQIESLRQPELQEFVERLQVQTRKLTQALQAQPVDFDLVQTLADALGDVATGMESLADSLPAEPGTKPRDNKPDAPGFLDKLILATAKLPGAGNLADGGPSEYGPTLRRSAALLKNTQAQLHKVWRNRQQLESAKNDAVLLGEAFALTLPLLTDQLNGQLRDQDQALEDLGQGIDELGDALPAFGDTLARMLQIGKLLAWLLAAVVGLHGAYLLWGTRTALKYS
jgi:hypothetical protein